MKRRDFLKAGAAPFLIASLPWTQTASAAPRKFRSIVEEFRDTGSVKGLSLSEVRKQRQIDIGFCLPSPQTGKGSGPLWETGLAEFSSVCPEWNLNWDQDWKGTRSLTDINALHEAGLKVRGHSLYYYQNIPWKVSFAKQDASTPGELGDFIFENVRDRVARWGDKVSYWVINETISNKKSRGMRIDPITKVLGKDLFRILVAAVKDVDPNKKVEMNDFVIERRGPAATDHLFSVAEYLSKYDLKFDQVGFQCHIDWYKKNRDFHPNHIIKAARKLKSLDVDIAITEIDVDDRPFKLSPSKRDLFVAEQYYDALRRLSDIPRLTEVSTWSAFDSDNWIRRGHKDKGKYSAEVNERSRTGWFDDQFKRKLAYYAVCGALT